jgi:uracil phosphoribosyltransferase
MLYEATRDLPLEEREIETPLVRTKGLVLAGKKLCFVPILRAGLGFADAMLELVPSARVGHIGLYREPTTLTAIEYYLKLPDDISKRLAIVVDPMLATGHSASAAVHRLKENGAEAIKFLCLVAAPPGLEVMRTEHSDVMIYTAAVDERLDDHAYIVPGLGDAGDRLFGTK